MRAIRDLIRDARGAVAIEFAFTFMPFLLLVFGILEMALMFFVDTTLDSALSKTVREVKTGTAAKQNWTLATFKAEMCDNMADTFGCATKLMVRTTVMADFSSVLYVSPVQNGVMSVVESFTAGGPETYMLIQAYLPFDSILARIGATGNTLADGSHALSAVALFRVEPYE